MGTLRLVTLCLGWWCADPNRNMQAAFSTLVYWHQPDFYPHTSPAQWLDTAVRETFASRREVLSADSGLAKCFEPSIVGHTSQVDAYVDAYTAFQPASVSAHGVEKSLSHAHLPAWLVETPFKPPDTSVDAQAADTPPSHEVWFMTAAAGTYAMSALCTVASIRRAHPDPLAARITFWDLGVVLDGSTAKQVATLELLQRQLAELHVEYRVFDYSAYPASFRLPTRHDKRTCAEDNQRWKPAVLAQALGQFAGPVVWYVVSSSGAVAMPEVALQFLTRHRVSRRQDGCR